MKRTGRGAWLVVAAGLAVGYLGETTAQAAPPYDAELTPGELRGIPWEAGDPWPAGFFEYLPQNYLEVPPDHRYPLLVTLGGIGTMDMPSTCPGNADWCTHAECEAAGVDGICRAYRRGPAVEIIQGVWDDTTRPFIVIQVQNFATTNSTTDYDRDVVDDMVDFALANYPVDPRRIYLLGNSQGGRGVMQYTSLYNRRMAAVTMGPGGTVQDADAACRFEDTAFWAFHGENDDDANIGVGVFDPCLVVEQVRMFLEPDQYPMLPGCVDRVGTPISDGRMTMFDNTAHNAWTPAFEDIAFGFGRSTWSDDQFCGYTTNFYDYDAAMDPDGVYSWLLSFDRPDTDAGMDFVVPGDAAEFALVADTEDDDPITYTWTQLSGPPVTITDGDTAMATVTDFEYDQTYTFEVYAIDADQQWDIDEVEVTVESEIVSSDSSGGGSEGGSTSGDSDGPADTTAGEASGGNTSGAASSGGTPPVSGSGDGPIGDDDTSTGGEDTDTAGAGDGGSGCGCRATDGGSGFGGLLGLLGLVMVRRRRRS